MKYSFALAALALAACTPAPAPEPTAASNDPAAIHARILTLDTHLDTPVLFERQGWDFAARHEWRTNLSHVDLPRMGEVTLVGQAPTHLQQGYAGLVDHLDAVALAQLAPAREAPG